MTLGGLFDLEKMKADLAEYQEQMVDPSFWDDPEQAQQIIDQSNHLKHRYQSFYQIEEMIEENYAIIEMLDEDEDPDLHKELEDNTDVLGDNIEKFELELLLSAPYDTNNAIVEIHPGAGGTESQDWGQMLYRMYQRWIESKDFNYEVLDYQAGEEAGLKSATILVKGHNAYGLLKAEQGVHRLVRISPFDSSGRRHTSFVSIDVVPEVDDSIEIEVNESDLRIDTYRASGAGGQHVNKTDSAVRITHEPTGIVAASQSGRSQIQNREVAMNLLKSKLYQLEIEKKESKMAELRGEQKEIGWGSQIRSYVFHPYSMVKDHRTEIETGNTDAVMDGEIDRFIEAYLRTLIQT